MSWVIDVGETKMNEARTVLTVGLVSLALAATGCSGTDGSEPVDAAAAGADVASDQDNASGSEDEVSPPSGDDNPLASVDPSSLVPKGIVGLSPSGAEASPPDSVALTDDEVAKAREAGFKVGIVMQTMDIAWSTEQVRGITDRLTELGGEVIGVTDPEFDVATQISQIENMIQLAPDAIISIPVDDTATATAYEKIQQAGIKLILMDNVPRGLEHPTDYSAMVSADNQGNGAVAAAALSPYVPADGVVGIVGFGVDFFVTDEREAGFEKWMKENRPDITIKRSDFLDPTDAGTVGANFLTANPDISGIFTTWDAPGLAVCAAAREQGLNLPSTTINLELAGAIEIAQNGCLKGSGSQVPYDQGIAEANAAIKVLLGGSAPEWIAFDAVPVIQSNVLSAWETVYHQEPPSELVAACESAPGCELTGSD